MYLGILLDTDSACDGVDASMLSDKMRCCGKLGLCLYMLDLHLQVKRVIARGKFFWLATYGVILHIYFLSLQLVCFWFEGNLFLETQTCEVSVFVTGIALVFLGRILDSSTCLESPHLEHLSLLVWACLGSNLLLYGGACCSLVTPWCWLKGLPPAFAWWEVCLLVSHQVDLGCLGITCYLLDVLHSCFGCFHLLCKLPDLACREPVKVNTAV